MLEYVTAKSGYAAFDSSSGWMTRPAYLRCEVIDLPIAYSEQVIKISNCNVNIKL